MLETKVTEVEAQQKRATRDYQLLESRYRDILSENQLIKQELATFRRHLGQQQKNRNVTPLRTQPRVDEVTAMRRLGGYPYANNYRK